jgi:hypothetical protein
MKRKMIGLAYGAADLPIVITPRKGNMISGSNAVTGIATASVTHHVIIQAPTAKTLFAPGDTRSAGTRIRIDKKSNGPRRNPICLADRFELIAGFEIMHTKCNIKTGNKKVLRCLTH